ncbi:peptidoglycan D,D-transpeptidase FtsI family protein [Egicoccus halophilus]|uniref:Penicillin-binding protein n=1 Tax=Egicoccus halophilus TaxID=1670830 RepID=A0A8J3A6H5_9ACTN|nr:penicillin-binding protein 2 [Egicoccus halophilus]GGI04315.1 penicillin-binding protein [Egicoccus halophilus]
MTEQPRRLRALAASRVQRSARETGTRRIRWMLLIYGLLFALTFGQLINVQVVQGPDYADRGVRQRARIVDLAATRGRIYDREGDVLATSVQSASVYVDPRAYRPGETPDGQVVPAAGDSREVAEALAPLLDLRADDVRDRLERDAHFVYLGRQLDWEVGERIRELELPGVGVLAEPQRVYPAGPLAGQIVGFTGIDGEGLQGLEEQYDQVLRGRSGVLTFDQAPGGLGITSGTRELQPSEPGTDLVLTLDRDVQYAAEQAAANAVEEHDAAAASVVVLDVDTFEVLGMASSPGFDPNDRGNSDPETWRNRAVTDVFEPGSVQKALTVAAALEEGLVSATSARPTSRSVQAGGRTFRDPHPFPGAQWTLGDMVERSSNVGTIELAQQLGPERLYDYLREFGYAQPTGVGFPGESSGLLMPTENWWGTSLPTISIGQGVAVTLMQLATSYATLANDGVARTPRIVRGTVGEDGRLTPTASGGERRVVSPDTAGQVRSLLERAVSGEHGTGGRAAVEGYSVAGKTGTARKPSVDARGYSGEYVATFVGFAPVEDPEVVVAVMVDEPGPVFYGGLVAAPVFSEVMAATLAARRVAPDGGSPSLDVVMDEARLVAAETAALESEALPADDPGSPPVGDPVGD